ncbi:transaldolase [Prolixibacter sp. NT017]|uniref:transaldolase n=1 Tax=Prolixibacter sp. NT017 TaxID=2652390 RepID=UPI00127A8B0B|nr:transaldolase [Prolixibacter sp. NT017]GET24384.1 transaldolase [Prolixibacter sp. NT017]
MNTNNKKLNEQGVSLWLDNITRKILNDGTLKKYISELSVTGLTSNPTIFDNAISKSSDYDGAIRQLGNLLTDEEVFFELAIEDIQRAADLFRPLYNLTNGIDGFVSIEVSPVLAYDTQSTINAAKIIFEKVNRPNAFIKIPGTPEGLPAIEKAIAEGIPVNVTLLFSAEQYLAAAEAWLRGIETRAEKGLTADVRSVASVFVSRWDKAVSEKISDGLKNKLGLATSQKTYEAYLQFLQSNRVQRVMNLGVSPQRLLWASTGAKDPAVSDVIYIENLVAPFTVNTIPENTLLAFADHGNAVEPMPQSCTDTDKLLDDFKNEGVNIGQLAGQLQKEGAESFVGSWKHLIDSIQSKRKLV